ncbi:adenylate kinase [Dictyobacter arantiisoli]|uniref:Adenylate kinase n=1 Tax=Dictyobacter arantiisoli TaxID=2014874 RepID=A0A5A5TBU6_9CHLR|nr:adenylate kinase [Dictyobacter arantiisoli]GCF08970.1 adenylate kinase [Dictyobacter arantiisoli]
MNIILIGAQGSGKGTQAKYLANELGMHHVSSGDLFRKASAEGTAFGKQAQAYFDRGELVPDELTVAMVLEHISKPEYIRDGILLDGFPRTIAQAQALDEGLLAAGRSIDCSIYLEVPREELLHRLSGRYICRANQHVYNIDTDPPKVPGICDLDGSELYQRADDTGAAIEKRLDIFFHETIHLLDYYDQQHKLAKIDGNRRIEVVSRSLIELVKNYQ